VVEGNIMAVQLSTPSQPGDHASRLPQRVEEAIKAEQDRSENLIGWIQLAVILAFAALYFVSPKTSGSGSYLTVTAISIYLALTVIRLVMSHSFSMPPWMLALSVAFDMALLFGLIWSFHIQYGQPAAFYLKAPPCFTSSYSSRCGHCGSKFGLSCSPGHWRPWAGSFLSPTRSAWAQRT
jgi:hypothetical protein